MQRRMLLAALTSVALLSAAVPGTAQTGDDFPNRPIRIIVPQAAVEIESDGTTLKARCEHPRGSAENPLSRGEIEGKFRTYADGVLSPSAIAATIDAVGDLENLGSVRKLMDMLRAAPRRARAERATLAAAHG